MDWLTQTLGISTALAGLSLTIWALFWDRSRARKRCPRCWYDMMGAPSPTCPECGHLAPTPRTLHKTRRHRGRAAAGLAAIFVGALITRSPAMRAHGWPAAMPIALWRTILPFIDPPPSDSRDAWMAMVWARGKVPSCWDRLVWAHRCRTAIDSAAASAEGTSSQVLMPTWEVQGAVADLRVLGYYGRLGLPSVHRLLASHAMDEEVRAECVWTICALGGHLRATPHLVSLILNDPSTRVRQVAIEALNEFPSRGPGGGPAALHAFLHALHDPDAHVRYLAARGLRDSGPPEPHVIAALERCLAEDTDGEVRLFAGKALTRMRTEITPAR